MVGQDAGSEDDESNEPAPLDRRSVLKGLGAGAVVGLGVTGRAAATTETDGPPVFCGCSQVCACGSGQADILFAEEDGDGFEFTWHRYVEFNFCVSTDDPGVPDGKIVAIQVAGTRWLNPGTCAEKAIEVMFEEMQFTHPTPESKAGGQCGHPPCEHPGGGGGPPDGGGPPADAGPPDSAGPPSQARGRGR